MRKEIAPELYNYNKFPGPEFRQVGTKIVAEQLEFEMVENQKNAFDVTAFNQRFSEILTKYDYLVGDWGNEQLRLRGFYKDERQVDNAAKISRLEDYLLEYCNYGCAYFVLENPEPKKASFDKKTRKKRDSEPKQRFKQKKRQPKKVEMSEPKKKAKERRFDQKEQANNRHFVIRWK
ncbi:YutD family protein [Streptococcus himalayensis]|uniref:Transcriptional regulator n=1 Tax=Streptococcus himalayensis TaxID=1888195 RepID=A0A917A9U0_9STRE|nr:YutD family protein [Streptococcus himalayensis]GGE35510.1 transcriptional regulator [Streptococcus himalayensis]